MKDKLEQTFLLTLTGNAKLKLSIVVEHCGLISNAAASSTNLIRPSQSFRKGLTKAAKRRGPMIIAIHRTHLEKYHACTIMLYQNISPLPSSDCPLSKFPPRLLASPTRGTNLIACMFFPFFHFAFQNFCSEIVKVGQFVLEIGQLDQAYWF